jgi:ferredoxin
LKITVDPDKCVGSAYCQRIAPATFDLGDDGIAFVLDSGQPGTGEAAGAVREAEAACPAMAIAIAGA